MLLSPFPANDAVKATDVAGFEYYRCNLLSDCTMLLTKLSLLAATDAVSATDAADAVSATDVAN